MKKYKIIRMRFRGQNRVVKRGLSLEEAKEWCSREDTHKKDHSGNIVWFDGYDEE